MTTAGSTKIATGNSEPFKISSKKRLQYDQSRCKAIPNHD